MVGVARLLLRGVCIGALVSMTAGAGVCFAAEVMVEGLFNNAAMLRIDGNRKLLRRGETFGGVTLVSATAEEAVVEVGGKRHSLGMSRRIGTTYQEPAGREVRIPRNPQLQYITFANINGRRMPVMVDTGANIVAMNVAHAVNLGIDYTAGQPSVVTTAGGVARAWQVRLDFVDIAGIRVDHVDASVLDGAHPRTILLGMTYLRHVKIEEDAGVLVLSRDY